VVLDNLKEDIIDDRGYLAAFLTAQTFSERLFYSQKVGTPLFSGSDCHANADASPARAGKSAE